MRPPLVSRKLIPLAQSSELPATERNKGIDSRGVDKVAPGFNHRGVWIDIEVMELNDFDTCGL